jgi:erythritol kinase (D-erythritol 1-phosphate-forming)
VKDGVLIGVDAGTSVIKSVAFTLDGQQLAVAAVPNTYVTRADGAVEQDMAKTWVDTAYTIKLLAEKVPNLKTRAVALAVTGQGDGTWLIDKVGEPVAPAWLWLDARAAEIVENYFLTEAYADHYQRTGTGMNACQQNGQLAFLLRTTPALIENSVSAHHCKDWLYFKLTGTRATDPSEANFTFGNYQTRQYTPKVLNDLRAGETARLLPEIVDGTMVAHGLSAAAASATGLPSGLPVCLGYVDVICSGIGGGLFDLSGRSGCTIVGSTGMHMRMRHQNDVKLNTEKSGYTMCMPHREHVAQIQSNMASTLNIDWLLDLALGILQEQGVFKRRNDLLAGLDEKLLAEVPGRMIYHPYISQAGERGPFLDANARASFIGLETGAGFNGLMRSVFEGLCMAARDCYDVMGGAPSEVRVTGGAVKSRALRVMLASALNANVRTVSRDEAGASGAVMMAAVQQQLYPDMPSVVRAWIDPNLDEPTKPDPVLLKTYNELFPLYKKSRLALRETWRGQAALRKAIP